MSMDLSVVIVTYNSEGFLVRCLDSLLAATKEMAVEIFIYDSGSTDGGPALVERQYPAVRLRRGANVGFSAGNNAVLPQCTGDRILLLNPDTVLLPDSVHILLQCLENDPEIGAAGPALLFPDGTVQDHSAHLLPTPYAMVCWLLLLDKLEWRLRFGNRRTRSAIPPAATCLDGFTLLSWTRDQPTEVPYLSGACLLLRKTVLDQVGLLDAASPLYLDDIDYCRRIGNAGWKLFYAADASVTHFWQGSSASVQRDADFYALLCHSVWIYLCKHHGRLAGITYRLVALSAGLLRSTLCRAACLLPGRYRGECRRHLQMANALLRWATRTPAVPATLYFAPAPATPLQSTPHTGVRA